MTLFKTRIEQKNHRPTFFELDVRPRHTTASFGYGPRQIFLLVYSLDDSFDLLHSIIIQTGEETFFKIKRTTKMSKVFETYASRKGVQAASLRFMLDGERIEANQTPKMLELDDQDQIDCMLEQMGGCGL
jgi:hypothetical protein